MIHLTDIHKQHGSQILFTNASFQILPQVRSGLVGGNGEIPTCPTCDSETEVYSRVVGYMRPVK